MMKQRLIGAAVLIALGVIFIPMLLTGDGKFLSGEMETNVPPKPMYELEAPQVLPLDKRAGQPSDPVVEAEPEVNSPEISGPATEKVATSTPTAEPIQDAAKQDNKPEPKEEKEQPTKSTATAVKPPAEAEKVDTKSVSKTATIAKTPEVSDKTQKQTAITKPASTPTATQAKVTTKIETVKQKPVVSGWAVQLGSFSVQKNALNLRDKLRKNGHASFVEEYKRNGKTSYRVRVGPELTRDLAVALKKKLKTETKIDGFVVEFSGK